MFSPLGEESVFFFFFSSLNAFGVAFLTAALHRPPDVGLEPVLSLLK